MKPEDVKVGQTVWLQGKVEAMVVEKTECAEGNVAFTVMWMRGGTMHRMGIVLAAFMEETERKDVKPWD